MSALAKIHVQLDVVGPGEPVAASFA